MLSNEKSDSNILCFEATSALSKLVAQAVEEDDDGIDIHFLNEISRIGYKPLNVKVSLWR